MFSKNTPANQNAPSGQLPEIIGCIITEGTTIEGNIRTTADFRLDGQLVGDLNCQGKLIMGETGRIKGTVHSRESQIKGKVEGEVTVRETLLLEANASIEGSISARKLVVETGASYSGDCRIGS